MTTTATHRFYHQGSHRLVDCVPLKTRDDGMSICQVAEGDKDFAGRMMVIPTSHLKPLPDITTH